MRTYFVILILSAVAAFLLTPLVRMLAFRFGALDQPDARKVHQTPMPRLGGLAVFGGFCFPWASFYLFNNRVTAAFQNYEKLFLVLMLGATAMLLLGVVDDFKGLGARSKFTVQIITAVGLYFGGYRITFVSNPFGDPIPLGWLSLPVSVLWIVGITNAINLLDGIDGLAAGVTACIALSVALINVIYGNIIVALLTLCLAGACLGFLPYNFAPARIFLGDSGSLFIGLVLSCIGMLSLFKAATATFIAVPLLMFGLPLFDTTSVLVSRWRRGAPLFQADKSHVHHQLLRLGWNHKQAAYFLYAVTLALGGLATFLSVQQSRFALLLGAGLVLIPTTITWIYWRLRARRLNGTTPK